LLVRPGCRRRPPRLRTSRPRVLPVRARSSGPTASAMPVTATPPGPAPPVVRAVRRIPAATRLRVGCAWSRAGSNGQGACGSDPSGHYCRRTGFARAPIRPAPRARRRFPQLPQAAVTTPSTYLSALHSSDHLYANTLLSVGLTNDPAGLTVTGTGAYSMVGPGAIQIGYGCTMEQRAVGIGVRYFIVSKSHVDLFSSSVCGKSTHPTAIAWKCLPGSLYAGNAVTVRLVGTRIRTRQRHTHEQ
jgi:hypothetical protein